MGALLSCGKKSVPKVEVKHDVQHSVALPQLIPQSLKNTSSKAMEKMAQAPGVIKDASGVVLDKLAEVIPPTFKDASGKAIDTVKEFSGTLMTKLPFATAEKSITPPVHTTRKKTFHTGGM